LANIGWPNESPQIEAQSAYDTRQANLVKNNANDAAQSGDLRGPFDKVFSSQNKGLPLKEITDGLSNTVMLGEVRQYPGEDGRGLLYLGSGLYNHFYTPNTASLDKMEFCEGNDRTGTLQPSAPCTRDFGQPPRITAQTARSNHAGGVNLSFVDGRSTFVSDGVDVSVWRRISTRAGGEVASEL